MAGIKDYRPDRNGLKDLLTSTELAELCAAKAEQVAMWARSHTRSDSGQHAASIHVERVSRAGLRKDRVAAEVIADAPHSASVEFGNARQSGDHALRSALDHIGGD